MDYEVNANGAVKIEGLEGLQRQIDVLSPKGQRRVWRNSFRAAGQSVLQKQAAKNLRGNGHRALARQLKTSARATNVNVTVRIGAKGGTQLNRIGHLLEKGTRRHTIHPRRQGKVLKLGENWYATAVEHPGARSEAWLIPAMQEKKHEVSADIARRIGHEVQKAKLKGF